MNQGLLVLSITELQEKLQTALIARDAALLRAERAEESSEGMASQVGFSRPLSLSRLFSPALTVSLVPRPSQNKSLADELSRHQHRYKTKLEFLSVQLEDSDAALAGAEHRALLAEHEAEELHRGLEAALREIRERNDTNEARDAELLRLHAAERGVPLKRLATCVIFLMRNELAMRVYSWRLNAKGDKQHHREASNRHLHPEVEKEVERRTALSLEGSQAVLRSLQASLDTERAQLARSQLLESERAKRVILALEEEVARRKGGGDIAQLNLILSIFRAVFVPSPIPGTPKFTKTLKSRPKSEKSFLPGSLG